MAEKIKSCKDSFTTMTQLVLPNDTNVLGNLMGGNLLKWMDVASSIAAARHCGGQVVTAAVDNVSFQRAIHLGDVVTINAQVTRVFRSSMEVYMEVFVQSFGEEEKFKCNEAYYTFVALDKGGRPKQAIPIKPKTQREKQLFEGAMRRRELRLILAGRMKPEDAGELKALFD
jgi:acyl-CoA hydrolase